MTDWTLSDYMLALAFVGAILAMALFLVAKLIERAERRNFGEDYPAD